MQVTSPAAPRHDIYAGIHKALRAFMTDTLGRVGWMDALDPVDLAETLSQVKSLLEICAGHLQHENDFIHRAMEARRPGTAARIAGEHVDHEQHIAALRTAVSAVERASAAERPRLAHDLYRALARFIADNFEHMEYEETEHNAVLWSAYSDAEIAQIEQNLVRSLPPDETMTVWRWMIPYKNHAERVAMLSGMRQFAPRHVFEGALALARSHLSDRDWAKLATALELTVAKAA
ncbi:MAG TPA: hemerythrin domain-containing protein [Nevskiaceae bacterium]|nr:hemerythrin domain-containing protein [Nevskiaceae bacterium]